MRVVARPLFNVIGVGITFGTGMLHAFELAPVTYPFLGTAHSLWWTVFAAVQLFVGYALGLPELAVSRLDAALRSVAAFGAAVVAISMFQTMLAMPLLPRSALLLIALIHPLWTVMAWNLSMAATARAATRHRAFVVVERPEDVADLVHDLAGRCELPASVVGSLTLDQIKAAGTTPLLTARACEVGATVLVLDTAAQSHGPTVEQAAVLHRQGVRIRTLSLFYEQWVGKLPHPELARVSLLFDIGELHRARYVRAKRVVDLGFAAVGLLALAPVAVAVLALNRWFNRGPLIFRQTRVGRLGQEFVIYKLRTMTPGRDSTAWTTPADDRVTPLGRWLRRTHLDELPQVINIIKGDLSLVGPRPEQPTHVAELADKIDFYEVRHIVRPGLTGWAQVKQGYAADHDDAFEKLQYDIYYLRRQGLALDLKVLRRTARRVLRGAGR
jgi:lipopolysaccharide/colanic/teichoic acid biosynthesis glycosyltransferase